MSEPQFKNDHRSNPGLHALYVKWAMHHLDHARDFMDLMESFSNWNASQLAEAVRKQVAELVKTDAAYHDAAAKLFADEEPESYHGPDEEEANLGRLEKADADIFYGGLGRGRSYQFDFGCISPVYESISDELAAKAIPHTITLHTQAGLIDYVLRKAP